MTNNSALLPMVNKFFENDLENAVHILEEHDRRGSGGSVEISSDGAGCSCREGPSNQLCRHTAKGSRRCISQRIDVTSRSFVRHLDIDAPTSGRPGANEQAYF